MVIIIDNNKRKIFLNLEMIRLNILDTELWTWANGLHSNNNPSIMRTGFNSLFDIAALNGIYCPVISLAVGLTWSLHHWKLNKRTQRWYESIIEYYYRLKQMITLVSVTRGIFNIESHKMTKYERSIKLKSGHFIDRQHTK